MTSWSPIPIVFAIATMISQARGVQTDASEFIVLRTDRVVTWTSTGESSHLNCSILGMGDASQVRCDSRTSDTGISRVYEVALVVGSNRVGYVISCGGGLIRRIGCKALTAGQVLKGSVSGGKLSIVENSKTKHYRIETSAYIGPVRGNGSSTELAGDPPAAVKVSVRPASNVEKGREVNSTSQATPGSPQTEAPSIAAAGMTRVHVTSTPSGGEIYIDGKFFGNTPSRITLAPGEYNVRIALGDKSWSRSLQITSGEVTLNANLSSER